PTYSWIYATMLIGVLILLPLSIWELYQPNFKVILEPKSVFVLFYVGFLASVVSLIFWNIGVSKVGASKAGIFLNLVPLFAIIFAIIFEKETLIWYQTIGGSIVIIGVLLSTYKFSLIDNSLTKNKLQK
ncbi:MAG TPA: DMT family transporter, partial [Peptostreptococcaceae bacterium]|nr:DMT family transporter [Peptostreptococcaceae bacterium]